jgi:hypothetical protein
MVSADYKQRDRIAAYFLECASVKQTARQFDRTPEYIRRVLAHNKIDFYQYRQQYLSREKQ